MNTNLIEMSIQMCCVSWGGQIPPNAVGGNIPLALGTLLYNQHNTNLTQHTTTHNNQHTTRWHDAGRHPPQPLMPPIALRHLLRRNLPAHHIMGDAGHAQLCIFCAMGVAWGAKKATHPEMERGTGPRPSAAAVGPRNVTTNR